MSPSIAAFVEAGDVEKKPYGPIKARINSVVDTSTEKWNKVDVELEDSTGTSTLTIFNPDVEMNEGDLFEATDVYAREYNGVWSPALSKKSRVTIRKWGMDKEPPKAMPSATTSKSKPVVKKSSSTTSSPSTPKSETNEIPAWARLLVKGMKDLQADMQGLKDLFSQTVETVLNGVRLVEEGSTGEASTTSTPPSEEAIPDDVVLGVMVDLDLEQEDAVKALREARSVKTDKSWEEIGAILAKAK